MKIKFTTMLLSTLLLTTACSKSNNESASSNPSTPETAASNQNDPIKDIQASIELNGKTEIDAYIKELSDDEATIFMVDSNLQREKILPSEKAFA